MDKEKRYRIDLCQSAVVDIYLSMANGRAFWPFRLEKIGESKPNVRSSSLKHILDSGTGEQQTSPRSLVKKAKERDADFIIADDTLATLDKRQVDRRAVAESAYQTQRLLRESRKQNLQATVLIPLQPPHVFHYAYLTEFYPEQARHGYYAVGGMKDMSTDHQLKNIRALRDAIGYGPYLHGLGFGTSRSMIDALRQDPKLLDSVDFSTPIRNASTGQIAGTIRTPQYISPPTGKDSSTAAASTVVTELITIALMLAPSKTTPSDLKVTQKDARKAGLPPEAKLSPITGEGLTCEEDSSTTSPCSTQGTQAGLSDF